DEQREEEQGPGDLARRGNREPEHEQEREAEQTDRDSYGARDVRVYGRKEERTGGEDDECDGGRRDDEQHGDLPARDAEERAEEQRVDPVQHAVVEADEEKAERERECLQRSDRGRLRGEAPA